MNQVYEYTEEYCSIEIGHDYESTGHNERLDKYSIAVEKQCLNCGKIIEILSPVPNEDLED